MRVSENFRQLRQWPPLSCSLEGRTDGRTHEIFICTCSLVFPPLSLAPPPADTLLVYYICAECRSRRRRCYTSNEITATNVGKKKERTNLITGGKKPLLGRSERAAEVWRGGSTQYLQLNPYLWSRGCVAVALV